MNLNFAENKNLPFVFQITVTNYCYKLPRQNYKTNPNAILSTVYSYRNISSCDASMSVAVASPRRCAVCLWRRRRRSALRGESVRREAAGVGERRNERLDCKFAGTVANEEKQHWKKGITQQIQMTSWTSIRMYESEWVLVWRNGQGKTAELSAKYKRISRWGSETGLKANGL
jgi:hypothetical protein